MSQISDLGRKSGDCARGGSCTSVAAHLGHDERTSTHTEHLAAEPRVELDGELVRLGRRKVGPEQHHAEQEGRRRVLGPERRAVDGGRLRLVHLDPEEGEVVRHLLDAEARVVPQVRPVGLRARERGSEGARVSTPFFRR